MIELILPGFFLLDEFTDRIVKNRNTFIHGIMLHRILRQDFPEELLEQVFLLDGAGDMDTLNAAFQAVLQGMDYMEEKSPQDFLAGDKGSTSMAVGDFLVLFIITDPALHIVENAEALIDITVCCHLHRIITEKILRFFLIFQGQHRNHAGKQIRFGKIMEPVVEDGIVDFIFPNARRRFELLALEVEMIEIRSGSGIGGTKVNSYGQMKCLGFPHRKIHQRHLRRADVFRDIACLTAIDPENLRRS